VYRGLSCAVFHFEGTKNMNYTETKLTDLFQLYRKTIAYMIFYKRVRDHQKEFCYEENNERRVRNLLSLANIFSRKNHHKLFLKRW